MAVGLRDTSIEGFLLALGMDQPSLRRWVRRAIPEAWPNLVRLVRPGRTGRRLRDGLTVESDLGLLDDLFPWERELLAPMVASLLDDALANPEAEDDDYSIPPFARD